MFCQEKRSGDHNKPRGKHDKLNIFIEQVYWTCLLNRFIEHVHVDYCSMIHIFLFVYWTCVCWLVFYDSYIIVGLLNMCKYVDYCSMIHIFVCLLNMCMLISTQTRPRCMHVMVCEHRVKKDHEGWGCCLKKARMKPIVWRRRLSVTGRFGLSSSDT